MVNEQNKVNPARIAMDVVQRKLHADDIRKLCEREDVRAVFMGKTFTDRRPKQEWDREYLYKLYYAVVGEAFNLDYLLYLDEVAEYVKNVKIVKRVVAGAIIILVIIAGIIVFRYVIKA